MGSHLLPDHPHTGLLRSLLTEIMQATMRWRWGKAVKLNFIVVDRLFSFSWCLPEPLTCFHDAKKVSMPNVMSITPLSEPIVARGLCPTSRVVLGNAVASFGRDAIIVVCQRPFQCKSQPFLLNSQ